MMKQAWVRCVVAPAVAGKAYHVSILTGQALPDVYAEMLKAGAEASTVEQLAAKLGVKGEAAPTVPAPKPAAANKPK